MGNDHELLEAFHSAQAPEIAEPVEVIARQETCLASSESCYVAGQQEFELLIFPTDPYVFPGHPATAGIFSRGTGNLTSRLSLSPSTMMVIFINGGELFYFPGEVEMVSFADLADQYPLPTRNDPRHRARAVLDL